MPFSSSRREFLLTTGSAAAFLAAQTGTAGDDPKPDETADIPAILPRGKSGHHFVLYADCCSGVPGAPNEKTFAAVNGGVARIQPTP